MLAQTLRLLKADPEGVKPAPPKLSLRRFRRRERGYNPGVLGEE